MENVTLEVKGMSCGHCVNAVENNVGALVGVSKVSVNLGEGKVEIEFNPSEVTLEEIKDVIDDQGYDVI
ncbi:copper chaperone CopZ [Halalkalibacter urbisdiaboli]|uniref:copper chaperone CopZ n=1 Tax=Halalkalibacter urbisdiaboli TaxID=1960589 RepID=UPI000B4405A9|nr:copper chaperone CopZ [Halalkalibacter urbisdiaboli]